MKHFLFLNPFSTVGKKIYGFSVEWAAVMCLHTREKKIRKSASHFSCFLDDLPTELNRRVKGMTAKTNNSEKNKIVVKTDN
jgi:hypothetical protein